MAVELSKGAWLPAPHLILISRLLCDIVAGVLTRLMVFLPPRHGKSELISKYFPAWFLGNNPSKRVIISSYEADFAASWGRKAREVLIDPAAHKLFGWSPGQGSGSRWHTRRGGELVTAGVGGPITGRGANVFVIDDPVKNAEEANSVTMQEKVYDWYRSTARTRLEPGGAMILVMTRWNMNDLAGKLTRDMNEGGEKWRVVSLPGIAKDNDLLGRRPGDALWPDRYSAKELEALKTTLGTYWYTAMYDQVPAPPGGAIFKENWFGRYDFLPVNEKPFCRVQSWDTGFKTNDGDSYCVCTQVSLFGQGYFVEEVWRERLEYPDLKRKAILLYQAHLPDEVLIEDKASGQSLIQELRRETPIPVLPFKVDTDKVSRAHACTPECEAGKVFVRRGASWYQDWIGEMTAFPTGETDDQVDSFTQAMNRLKTKAPILLRASDHLVDTGFKSAFMSGDL